MVTVQVILYHFHWFQFFQACLFGDFVFTVIGIVFQMAYVGDIAHVAHFIS